MYGWKLGTGYWGGPEQVKDELQEEASFVEVFIIATEAFFTQSDFQLRDLSGELAGQTFFGSASLESLLTCSSASGHGDSESRGY